jgi:UDP-2,3-diacylglucosamine hydrolase
MHGNRDFLLGQQFAHAAGATLIQEPYLLEHQGQRYLLLHGDVLCTLDTDYMNFRNMVRKPEWQQAFLTRPLSERRAFAAEARAASKDMNSNKAADIMDVTQQQVIQLLNDYDITTLIHGHTHRPAVHEVIAGDRPCHRIVLGDWDEFGWYVSLEGNAFPRLQRFPL